MIVSITNATPETMIVAVGILTAVLVSIRPAMSEPFFPVQMTTELKGLAILMVIVSHIGYFLVNDHNFLVPFSNYAGVGVDIFFILSGYGLVAASLKRPLSVGQFYLKRLLRIYLPVVLTLIIFLLLDGFWLHRVYPADITIKNVLGWFPQADLYRDIDSPLWFITPLLVYYLLFPILFWRRFSLLSALAIGCLSWLLIQYLPNWHIVTEGIFSLYRLHFLAFPLGMALGTLINQPPTYLRAGFEKCLNTISSKKWIVVALRWKIMILAAGTLVYTHYHSYVGLGWKKEQVTSLVLASAFLCLFLFKKVHSRILILFGTFSFEMYLLHWPLLYRYNVLYAWLPAGVATLGWITILTACGYLYHRLTAKIFQRLPGFSKKISP